MTKEALTLALEALELAGGNLCEALHHPKKLQHGIGEPCPAVAKYDQAITAIKEALSTKCVAQPEKTVCPFCSSEWVTAEQHDRKMDRMEQERCVGCEACIDTACGRDECPKGWPKAAHPEQEPVACVVPHGATMRLEWASVDAAHNAKIGPLYTTPPQRTWVELTAGEISKIWGELPQTSNEEKDAIEFGFAIETALRKRNA